MTPLRPGNRKRSRLGGALAFAGAAVLALALVGAASAGPGTYPSTIDLPDGFRPEGIAAGGGDTFYAGSLAGGAIYKGDLRTGMGAVLVPPSGTPVAGLFVDQRSGNIFAAGTSSGRGLVFGPDGTLLASYPFATPGASFVNDVVVTRDAAYFTDSFRPFIYRVPLGSRGALPGPAAVQSLALGGDFVFVPGGFNGNGIEASADGKRLLLVNSTTGALYKVDPMTGHSDAVDLGGTVLNNGDGLRLRGSTLYVVQNRLNQIAVVDLVPGWASGAVVGTLTSPEFDVPTTVAAFGASLYAVNARFGVADPDTAEYWITRVSLAR